MKQINREKVVSMLIKAFLFVFSITVSLIFLEIGVRYFMKQGNTTTIEDPHIVWRYKPNINTIIEAEGGGSVRMETNSHGFIGEDFKKNKKDGVYRIANLGDSFTAALAVPYKENYVHQVGVLLSDKLDKDVQSINFGVSGQGSGEAKDTYYHYAREFSPDLVIIWFYLGNDFEDNLVYEERIRQESSTSFFHKIKRMARKSELAYLVVNRLAQVPFFADMMNKTVLTRVGEDELSNENNLPLSLRLMFTKDKENESAKNRTKKYLESLRHLTSEDGTKLFVAMVPAHFQVEEDKRLRLIEQYPQLSEVEFNDESPNDALSSILEELSIPYLDMTHSFKEQCRDICSLYVCPYCHLSSSGHIAASTIVTEKIIEDIFLIKEGKEDSVSEKE